MIEDSFDGFEGIIPEQRYRNAMLYHARKQTDLLEQIAQLLQRSNMEKEVIQDVSHAVRQRTGRGVGSKQK